MLVFQIFVVSQCWCHNVQLCVLENFQFCLLICSKSILKEWGGKAGEIWDVPGNGIQSNSGGYSLLQSHQVWIHHSRGDAVMLLPWCCCTCCFCKGGAGASWWYSHKWMLLAFTKHAQRYDSSHQKTGINWSDWREITVLKEGPEYPASFSCPYPLLYSWPVEARINMLAAIGELWLSLQCVRTHRSWAFFTAHVFLPGFCKRLMFTLWLFCAQRRAAAVRPARATSAMGYSVIWNQILSKLVNKCVN